MVKTLQDKYVQDVYLQVGYDPGLSDTVVVSVSNKAICQISYAAWKELCHAFRTDDEVLALAYQHGIEPYLSPEGTDEMHCLKGDLLAFAKAL